MWDAQQSPPPTNFQPQAAKESHGTSEYFLQSKTLPEIISERHSQHTVSFPWDVKDSSTIASRYELRKPRMNLRDTLEDEIYNTF